MIMNTATRYGGKLLVCAALPVLLSGLASACDRRASQPAGQSAAAKRVVTLTPSSTEVVDALGAVDLIVGVDKYSTVPEVVAHLPKVGDFLSPSLEAILALHPDIIFLDAAQTRFATQLNKTGIKVFALSMQNLPDVRAALRTAGDALGRGAKA